MAVLSLNDRAMIVADEMAQRAGELDIAVHKVGKARVIDVGVKQFGSMSAGTMLATCCMADLATVRIVPGRVGNVALPYVTVNVNHPVAACMASQYAGWQIKVGDFFAMGSGPMRAVRGKEPLYEQIGLRERPGTIVGVLETACLPDERAITHIADACQVGDQRMTLLAARTASLAGGVQVVARSVETALHKLHELKFDLNRVIAGFGSAPLPPVAASDLAAIGRTNDAVLYGAEVSLYVIGDDDSLKGFGEQLPSSTSKDYGTPFAEIFKRYDHDFYAIDRMLFSPAAVVLQNLQTGSAFAFGATNHEVLTRSFFG